MLDWLRRRWHYRRLTRKMLKVRGNETQAAELRHELKQEMESFLAANPDIAQAERRSHEKYQARARKRYAADPGYLRMGNFKYQDTSLLSLWINGQPKPRRGSTSRPFSRRGLARWLAVVVGIFLFGLVGQVVWMYNARAWGQSDFWIPLAFLPDSLVREVDEPFGFFMFALSFGPWIAFTVLQVKSRFLRAWLAAAQIWLLLSVTMLSGMQIGRTALYEWARRSGLMNPDDPGATLELFRIVSAGPPVDGSSPYHFHLWKDAGADVLAARLAAFALLTVPVIILALRGKSMPSRLRVVTRLTPYATAIGLTGIMLARRGSTDIMLLLVAIAMALVWLPGELRTIQYCLAEPVDHVHEWHAAFDIVFCLAVILNFIILPE